MRKTFAPGLAVIHFEYNQGTSGGGTITGPGDTTVTYYDPSTGRTYFYDDTADTVGWYWLGDDGSEGMYEGTDPYTELPGLIIVEEP